MRKARHVAAWLAKQLVTATAFRALQRPATRSVEGNAGAVAGAAAARARSGAGAGAAALAALPVLLGQPWCRRWAPLPSCCDPRVSCSEHCYHLCLTGSNTHGLRAAARHSSGAYASGWSGCGGGRMCTVHALCDISRCFGGFRALLWQSSLDHTSHPAASGQAAHCLCGGHAGERRLRRLTAGGPQTNLHCPASQIHWSNAHERRGEKHKRGGLTRGSNRAGNRAHRMDGTTDARHQRLPSPTLRDTAQGRSPCPSNVRGF